MYRYFKTLTYSFALLMAVPFAHAQPAPFLLDQGQSIVGFTYDLSGTPTEGTMPVSKAAISLDLDNLPASTVDVTLDPTQAKAGYFWATNAMRSEQVLAADNHPTIRFVSTSVRGDLNGGTVSGNLTVRGVTRPVILAAQLYRQSGTEVTDRDRLQILLTGRIDRNAFGASGFPGFVGPKLDLRIVARIERAG
ncbi:MAG: YceI family protein [Pseudomonadota bacterium]